MSTKFSSSGRQSEAIGLHTLPPVVGSDHDDREFACPPASAMA